MPATKRLRMQERAIAALVEHGTIRQAADAIGINEKTLRVWMHDEGFARAYAEARREGLDTTNQAIARAADAAVELLRGVMADPDVPAGVRVIAAKAVLDAFFKAAPPARASGGQEAAAKEARPAVNVTLVNVLADQMRAALHKPFCPGLPSPAEVLGLPAAGGPAPADPGDSQGRAPVA